MVCSWDLLRGLFLSAGAEERVGKRPINSKKLEVEASTTHNKRR